MAQIKTGTVQVQDGSVVVTEVAGVIDWNLISVGSIFAVPGRDQSYLVNAVDYISNPKTLTLASPYIGPTVGAVETVAYCITKDFTPNFRIPLMSRNDLETATTFSRAMQAIDQAIGLRLISSVATSASINAGTSEVTVTLPTHNLITDQVVTISGAVSDPAASNTNINGTHIITVVSRDTFKYSVTAIAAATVTTPPVVSYRSAISLGESHTLPSHNFKVGTALRYDATNGFVPASSRGGEINGLIVGVVSSVSGSSFTLCSSGPIYGLQGLASLPKGTVLYLGPDPVPVNLTATQPTLGAILRSVSSLTRVSTVATAVSTAHGFANGQQITIQGATQSEYNGLFYITVVDENTFTYTVSGTPATPATGTIKASDPLGQLRIPVFVVLSHNAADGLVFGQLVNFPIGQVPQMAGASETVSGAAGAVPAPPASVSEKFLSNRGLWSVPSVETASVKFGSLKKTPTFVTADWTAAAGEPPADASIHGALVNVNSRVSAVEAAGSGLKFEASVQITSSRNWTCPSGVTKIKVAVLGGGGGGAGQLSGNTWYFSGAGGGGGGYSVAVLSVSPGTVYPVTVGLGGDFSADGGNSSFASLLIAFGGKGASAAHQSPGGAGGLVGEGPAGAYLRAGVVGTSVVGVENVAGPGGPSGRNPEDVITFSSYPLANNVGVGGLGAKKQNNSGGNVGTNSSPGSSGVVIIYY